MVSVPKTKTFIPRLLPKWKVHPPHLALGIIFIRLQQDFERQNPSPPAFLVMSVSLLKTPLFRKKLFTPLQAVVPDPLFYEAQVKLPNIALAQPPPELHRLLTHLWVHRCRARGRSPIYEVANPEPTPILIMFLPFPPAATRTILPVVCELHKVVVVGFPSIDTSLTLLGPTLTK